MTVVRCGLVIGISEDAIDDLIKGYIEAVQC